MPDARRSTCRTCRRSRDEVGLISWAGLCGDCAKDALIENLDGLHTKSGVPWQRWRFGQARFLLGPEVANALYNSGAFSVPLDDLEIEA